MSSGDVAEPAVPGRTIGDPVGIAEVFGGPSEPVGCWGPPEQHHADLRTEPGRQSQGVANRVGAAVGEVERTELGVDLVEVRDGWHDAGLEGLDRHDVLEADPHRVPGEALGVGDHDAIGGGTEDLAQGMDLGCRAPATGRCVGLVRDEDRLVGDRHPIDAAELGLTHHRLHHPPDVFDVESGAVECAVGRHRPEHFADRVDPAFAGCGGALDNEPGSTHPEDHPVAALVERKSRLGDVFVGGGGTRGEEAGSQPAEHLVARCVVGSHHDHSTATAGPDPVLGQRDRLGGAGARRVDLGVGATGADQFGELGVPHGQDTEEEPAIEQIWVQLELAFDVVDPAVDLDEGCVVGIGLGDPVSHGTELFEFVSSCPVTFVTADFVGQLVEPGEGAGEDDARIVPKGVG